MREIPHSWEKHSPWCLENPARVNFSMPDVDQPLPQGPSDHGPDKAHGLCVCRIPDAAGKIKKATEQVSFNSGAASGVEVMVLQ